MKRRDLERYLREQGCRPLREGANHAVWHGQTNEQIAPVPRHREIGPGVVRAICRQLGVRPPANPR